MGRRAADGSEDGRRRASAGNGAATTRVMPPPPPETSQTNRRAVSTHRGVKSLQPFVKNCHQVHERACVFGRDKGEVVAEQDLEECKVMAGELGVAKHVLQRYRQHQLKRHLQGVLECFVLIQREHAEVHVVACGGWAGGGGKRRRRRRTRRRRGLWPRVRVGPTTAHGASMPAAGSWQAQNTHLFHRSPRPHTATPSTPTQPLTSEGHCHCQQREGDAFVSLFVHVGRLYGMVEDARAIPAREEGRGEGCVLCEEHTRALPLRLPLTPRLSSSSPERVGFRWASCYRN